MGKRSIWRAAGPPLALALTSLVGACAWTSSNPAPVVQKGGFAEAEAGPPQMPPPHAAAPPRHITVKPGQSVRRLAREYHVSPRAIIAANHLRPPYEIKIGQHLSIPGAGGDSEPIRLAALPPPEPPRPAEPPKPTEASPTALTDTREVIPLDDPPAGNAASPPLAEAHSHTAAATPLPPLPTPPAVKPSVEPSVAEEVKAEPPARKTSLPHGAHFSWPVRGRVLVGFGVGHGGAQNDGINIAAPRGTPIESVDAGVVAYAGNELRGYGNLVLIKHANGWITAYAHCDDLLVKKGERVHRGQVIAKVGTTGGVSEPQLHFELRRGKQPVDPQEFLTPAPSASADSISKRG
jgi:murein DD-endopeptidase MepM/ murein hydrolase activator NlpD